MATQPTIQVPRQTEAFTDSKTGVTTRIWYRWLQQMNNFIGGAAGPTVPQVSDVAWWSMSKR